MANAAGSRRILKYIAEVSYASTPATPTMVTIRNTGDSLTVSKDTFESAEITGDRALRYSRHGNEKVGGGIDFELCYGDFDDFMAAVLGADDWRTAVSVSNIADSFTVAATGKTITRNANSWLTDGLAVGDVVTFTGFATAANNDSFLITELTATVMTLGESTTLADETLSSPGPLGYSTDSTLRQGTTLTTYSIEKGFQDIDQFIMHRGCGINSMSFSFKPNAMITGSIDIMGAGVDSPTTATGATSTTAASTNEPFDVYTGSLTEDGSSIAIITGIDFSIESGLETNYALMNEEAVGATMDLNRVSGTMTAFVEDMVLFEKFLDETPSSLTLTLTDADGNDLEFMFPNIKYNGGDISVGDGRTLEISLPFIALYDDSYDSSIVITRTPA